MIYCSAWRWGKKAFGFCWRNGNIFAVVEFTLWPFAVILSNYGRLCGHQNILMRPQWSVLASCWSEVISVWTGARTDSKICRSDYETGRWEALKLKLAQMESDACSTNRHQPSARCLKAIDLWELDGYGNCFPTSSKHTYTKTACMSTGSWL